MMVNIIFEKDLLYLIFQMKPILTSRGKSITRHGLERVTSEASVPLQAQACISCID